MSAGYSWNYSMERGGDLTDKEDKFVFSCDNLASQSLQLMHAMLREKNFCDVVLNVDGTNIYAHRIVLASSSPYLMELFENESQYYRQNGNKSCPLYYYSLPFALEPFMVLINFMYTGRIELNPSSVCDVYKTAKVLRMQAVVDACTTYLSNALSISNCIEIRRVVSDAALIEKAEDFICEQFTLLIETKEFNSLPRLSFEVEGKLPPDYDPAIFSESLIKWFRSEVMMSDALNIIAFIEMFPNVTYRIHIESVDERLNGDKNGCQTNGYKESEDNCRDFYVTMSEFINATICEDDIATGEIEAKVLQVLMTSRKHYVGLVILNTDVFTFSLNIGWSTYKSPTELTVSKSIENEDVQAELFSYHDDLVPSLKEPRAGLGLISSDNEVIVIGGFNSTSCLNTVECYTISSKSWTSLPNLKFRRGRHCTAIVDDKIYVFGGSDGTQSLMNAECYDSLNKSWTVIPDFSIPKDNTAIVSCGKYIYAVGGTDGPTSSEEVFRYDCVFSCWKQLRSMITARATPCAILFENSLYVFGGHDGWKCLSSCEVYKPSLDQWIELPPMPVPRRSCGVVCFDDKIFLIGGTDGSSTLSRVDIFNPRTRCWEKGPSMRVPRSGLGVAILKDKVFVTGGFDGKNFLKSSEILVDSLTWKVYNRSRSDSESEKNVLSVFDCKEITKCD